MKTRIFLPAFLLFGLNILSAQEDVHALIVKGVELHDAGKYQEALLEYEKAQKLDPSSMQVVYEIGYTHNALGNYKTAIKNADKVLKAGGEFLLEAYLLKANSLDDAGQFKKAIQVFEQAIKRFPDEHLLHFNLGVTQYKQGMYKEAETALQNSILLNLSHASSHYLMGSLQLEHGGRVQGIMSLYLFLFLEPDSDRSADAFTWLWNAIHRGVEKEDDANYQINLDASAMESEFSPAEMALSMLAVTAMTEGDSGPSDEAFFAEVTDQLFSILGEQQADKEGFWWDVYVDLFAAVQANGHAEAFAYYVSQAKGEAVVQWLEENEEKLNAFSEWLDEY